MIVCMKRWWWGRTNPFCQIMNLTDKLTADEMRKCADWMKAEADSRTETTERSER